MRWFVPRSTKERSLRQRGSMGYRKRARSLKKLGFDSYEEYLKSNLWKEVKRRVFREFGNNCLLCPAHAETVHHNRYNIADLSGRNLRHVVPICHSCHRIVEFDGETKLTLKQARMKYKSLRNDRLSGNHLTDVIMNYSANETESRCNVTPGLSL